MNQRSSIGKKLVSLVRPRRVEPWVKKLNYVLMPMRLLILGGFALAFTSLSIQGYDTTRHFVILGVLSTYAAWKHFILTSEESIKSLRLLVLLLSLASIAFLVAPTCRLFMQTESVGIGQYFTQMEKTVFTCAGALLATSALVTMFGTSSQAKASS